MGFHDKFPFKTGTMLIEHPFTGETMPQVFMIAPDGTFETRFPVWYAGRVNMMLHRFMQFYVEPGSTLEITFSPAVSFGPGHVGDINTEIAAFERSAEPDREQLMKNLDWQVVQAAYRSMMDNNLRRLDEARAAGTMSEKAYGILRNIELSDYYVLISSHLPAGTQLPWEFYDFLREMPIDDPEPFAANGYRHSSPIVYMPPLSNPENLIINTDIYWR